MNNKKGKMNMKKAIFTIVGTFFALHALKNRKKKQNENTLYYPYTLLQKK